MKKLTSIVLIALPIIIFLCIELLYSQNIPYNDDYPSILEFLLNNKPSEHSFGELLHNYFAPYGSEHRIFFVRIFSAMQLALLGKLNFATLPIIGNIGLIVAFIYLLKSANIDSPKKYLLLVPAAFIVFQFQYWSNIVWSMASLSNTFIFCWIVLTLYFLFKKSDNNKPFILGLFFSVLATYTNGNGVFVLFTAAITFFFMKNWRKGTIVSAFFVILLLINIAGKASDSMADKAVHQGLGRIAGMFVVFLGSNFFHPSYIIVSIIAGICFILFFAYIFFVKKYYYVNPVACSLFLLLFLTAAAVATQRETMDIYTVAPSRYRIYGTLLIALSYIALIEVFPPLRERKLTLYTALPVSILFFLASNYVAKGKLQNRCELNRSYAFMLDKGIYLSKYYDSVYNLSLQAGLIERQNIPVAELYHPVEASFNIHTIDKSPLYQIDTTGTVDNHVFIKGWAGMQDNSNTTNTVYAIAYKQGKPTYYKANFLEVPDFINDKEMLRYATCGFLVVLPTTVYANADSLVTGIARGNDITLFRKLSINR